MMTAAKRKTVRNQAALDVLVDNIHALHHPDGVIKHPYFDERFAANSDGIREMKRKFCVAIVMLLENEGHIVDTRAK